MFLYQRLMKRNLKEIFGAIKMIIIYYSLIAIIFIVSFFVSDVIPHWLSLLLIGLGITLFIFNVSKDVAARNTQSNPKYTLWDSRQVEEEIWKRELRNYLLVLIFLLVEIALFLFFK